MQTNTHEPKVSIIIPVYNLGETVIPCISSALDQDFVNTEVIIVDDGSTDQSHEICRRCIQESANSKLFSKANGGLSSARNFGIERSTGDYLFFLDGDDVIGPHAIGALVSLAKQYDVDIVATTLAKVNSAAAFTESITESGELLSGNELLAKMLYLRGESGSSCGKLFKRELFSRIQFPEGQLFEDFGIIATIFSRVDRVFASKSSIYGYVTREESITTSREYGQRHVDGLESSLRLVRKAVEGKPELKDAFECYSACCRLRVASRLPTGKAYGPGNTLYVRKAKRAARSIVLKPGLTKIWRLRCALFGISKTAHNGMYRLYGIATGKVSL
ncbi:Glycosyl transferase family 2 [Olsenella sp. KH3B4]|uniref:glycosyltransferase family 2 protein n=1 Tax=Olsenella sp. KH3B4 TaxID=1855394 RepID=UPI0008C0C73F|nr:glycosyltransferase family 2 protein [Olsenella sp. KH3B4]SET31319.1 Glycosyl transferase family 2 [Olsenella sp. KH3B4]